MATPFWQRGRLVWRVQARRSPLSTRAPADCPENVGLVSNNSCQSSPTFVHQPDIGCERIELAEILDENKLKAMPTFEGGAHTRTEHSAHARTKDGKDLEIC